MGQLEDIVGVAQHVMHHYGAQIPALPDLYRTSPVLTLIGVGALAIAYYRRT